ncbi:hypothetical protein MKW94_013923 [Papaver nudicaule]|uniref:Xylanase inhibitor C-terminal domain-containing protein n=1 Tax=Papaver nudicaule TaxID=74823 RepID=A0AA41S4Y5_PAPNU|nr:hypothetical protein [Papaver nudicaule]
MGFPKFSYCISEGDSSGVLLLGNTSSPWVKPLSYTPLLQISLPLPYFDRAAYTVQLEGIMVSKKVLTLPKYALVPDHTGAGQTMIDSGTQFTFLLGPVYDALRNEFISQTRGILQVLEDTDFIFQGAMDLCYRVPWTRMILDTVAYKDLSQLYLTSQYYVTVTVISVYVSYITLSVITLSVSW